MNLYFDNTATTKVCEASIQAMSSMMSLTYGNPSSKHKEGLLAEEKINESTLFFANFLDVNKKELFYTSGGTESNNLAVLGIARAYRRSGKHIITTAFEHPSVGVACSYLEEEGYEITRLSVNKQGQISLEELEKAIREDTILVSVMHVNNEIGSILPLKEMGQKIKSKNKKTLFHVDAVQSFMKFDLKPRLWNVDLLSCSSHKIHGPKGMGLLYKKNGLKLIPLQFGGSQQLGVRPGTQNTPGIIGFYEASKEAATTMVKRYEKADQNKNYLLECLNKELPHWTLNSPLGTHEYKNEVSSPYIVNVRSKGIKGEVILHALEDYNIAVSTGSACSSKKLNVSHVLKAIGLTDIESDQSIRISIGDEHTQEEIKFLVESLVKIDTMFGRFVKK